MKNIKYIGFYDREENKKENRNYVLSAVNKMDYIINSLVREGFSVEIISPSWTYNKKRYFSSLTEIKKNVKLKLFKTLPWGNKLFKFISLLYSAISLFFYVMKNSEKNEKIIVYHSPYLFLCIYLLKKLKGIYLILEVEEKYSDVKKVNYFFKKMEMAVINSSDAFIYSTELFRESINNSKPIVICNGIYLKKEISKVKFNDGKKHLVYSGIIDKYKGSEMALEAALYLSNLFHIHIIGFGRDIDIRNLEDKINEYKSKTECIISYDGVLFGDEYNKFLQKCDLGLSTQKSNISFNETSFPSKIFSYLSNNLRVVSVRLKTIEVCQVNHILYYYDGDSPINLADSIKKIDFNDEYSGMDSIDKLDREFRSQLKDIICEGENNDS
ncbi:hypothetical protein [Carnobacterium maltaromaticum]|uniref:hypothetical protein n=1 Tax=Carnobacterium maltaromaticum TaxID=2751 RepID=UPI00070506EE|nr:hypothetical protein [Carnobacterium maltaromaticum]